MIIDSNASLPENGKRSPDRLVRNERSIENTIGTLSLGELENRNVMLYWDDSPPPNSVCAIYETWCSFCAGWNVSLFDREEASRFLLREFGRGILSLFSSCALPSMRSDFFRVFWAMSKGGIYSDVTFLPNCEPSFFYENKNITLVKLLRDGETRMYNGIFFAKKNCAEINLVADEIIKNVSQRKLDNVYRVTGPEAWVLALGKEETSTIAIKIYNNILGKAIVPSFYPETTRDTENHWSKKQNRMNIFCEPEIEKYF